VVAIPENFVIRIDSREQAPLSFGDIPTEG
jgi:hypothetical protein